MLTGTERPVLVPCGHCAGRGKVKNHTRTVLLAALDAKPENLWLATATLAGEVDISAEHAANELAGLYEAGLVERRKQAATRRSRGFEWRTRR